MAEEKKKDSQGIRAPDFQNFHAGEDTHTRLRHLYRKHVSLKYLKPKFQPHYLPTM